MLAALSLLHGVASAEGTARVQQSDGSVQVYRGVVMQLAGKTLSLRSPDRKDVLQIVSGGCSFERALQRCLPYKVTLRQRGRTHQIAITHGAVYMNLTDASHGLAHSSQRLAPHDVLVFLHTAHGTYVSAKGSLDAVKQ